MKHYSKLMLALIYGQASMLAEARRVAIGEIVGPSILLAGDGLQELSGIIAGRRQRCLHLTGHLPKYSSPPSGAASLE